MKFEELSERIRNLVKELDPDMGLVFILGKEGLTGSFVGHNQRDEKIPGILRKSADVYEEYLIATKIVLPKAMDLYYTGGSEE